MSTVATLETLLQSLGLASRLTRVSETVWTLQKGSVVVQIVAAPEFVVGTATIAPKVPDTPLEALYASLLRAQTQLLGAFFTLESDGSIRVNQIVPANWLQDRELAFLIGNVAAKAEEWVAKLAASPPVH